MKKFLAVLALGASLMISATAAQADYAAIAAGDGGFGWVEGGASSMERARAIAKNECRNAGYGSCESSVAERSWWYFVGATCGGRTYVGASQHSFAGARQSVYRKAWADGYASSSCYIEVQF